MKIRAGQSMLEPFVLRALLAGVGVALVAGALGCFVVWRRMAYFGDSLSHAALAGIPLGVLVGISESYAVLLVAALFALFLVWVRRHSVLTLDTILGIIAHGMLAVGMVMIALIDMPVFHLHSVLFGDILSVQNADIRNIYALASVVIMALYIYWDALVLMTVSEDLARVEGINLAAMNLLLVFLIAMMVAVSFQIVGVLLITSMLIIPAAAGRIPARSPEGMMAVACVVGSFSVLTGVWASMLWDTPPGPSIVVMEVLIFFVLMVASAVRRSLTCASG